MLLPLFIAGCTTGNGRYDESMMGMMKDPAMKEKMQKIHEQMHKNMGMMGGNDNMDSMKKDDSEHESHHPKK